MTIILYKFMGGSFLPSNITIWVLMILVDKFNKLLSAKLWNYPCVM